MDSHPPGSSLNFVPGFRFIVESHMDGILVLDAHGTVLYANLAAAEILGESLASAGAVALGGPVLPGVTTELPIARTGHENVETELRTVELSWQGKPAVLAVLRDISSRKRVEERQLESMKLEALGRMAAGITHDFNNVLAVILSGARLLRELIAREPRDPRIDKVIGDMLGRARNGAALTERLLTFARRQPLSPQAVDVNERINALGHLFASALGSGVAVEHRLDPDLAPALIDVDQFEVALLNLAVNARDAMFGKGRFILETCNFPDLPEGLPADSRGFIRLTVSDNGCGMTRDVLSRVFDPFFSTKGDQGTGLGLSQVYGTVTQSGGHVSIDSKPGQGTRIHLYLVAVREAKE